MLSYVGICLVVVVIGLVIAMTTGAVTRTILREVGDYKEKERQKSMATFTKSIESLGDMIGGVIKEKAESEHKKHRGFMERQKELKSAVSDFERALKELEERNKENETTDDVNEPEEIPDIPIKE